MTNKQLTPQQQALVVANMDFAQSLALIFRNCGPEVEDLQQESLYGLCQAALHYDESRMIEFKRFAFFWCRKAIIQAIHEYGHPMGIAKEERNTVALISLDKYFGTPTDAASSDHDDNVLCHDRLLYEAFDEAERESASQEELALRMERAFNRLTAKERTVITFLYGLDGNQCSGRETARAMNVDESRISRIRDNALRKLHDALAA